MSVNLKLCRRTFLKLGAGFALTAGLPRAHAEPAAPDPVPFGPPPQFDLVGDMLGTTLTYRTRQEETLLDVARAFNLGYVEMINANRGVDHWLPGHDTPVTLPIGHLLPDAPRRGIVINLADLRLYYFMADGRTFSFAVGSGREGYRSPRGTTTVVRKVENPTWYPTPGERRDNPDLPTAVPPGPDNPLGSHGIYLGWSGYIIHGTNNPWGVGRQISRGCIHCYPEGIAMLYPLVPIGTPVRVVNQTVKLGWSTGRLWLEVSPTQDEIDKIEVGDPVTFEPIPELEAMVLKAAGDAAHVVDWNVVRKTAAERSGVPIALTPVIADRVEPGAKTADAKPSPAGGPAARSPGRAAATPAAQPSGLY
ncbi:MAG: L,D-transpeptidase [Gemmatimonas sp.]